MGHPNTKSRRSPGTTPPIDIITYRYKGELVYVPVAPDHMRALSHARDAFPQLKSLSDASLSLSLTAPGNERKFVGISAPAWPKLIAHMSRYQIIDVHVTRASDERAVVATVPIPEITITYADADGVRTEMEPAPPYHKSDVMVDEKVSYTRPRTPSTSTMHSAKRSWFLQKLHGQ